MKIVVAPNAFKGSLSAQEVIACVRQSAQKCFADPEIIEVPIADGGDGTVEALVGAAGGQILQTTTRDPLGRPIPCIYGRVKETAVVGMSECSGLTLLTAQERNPLETSSHGTGDVIKKALDDGFTRILLGIGGSATNDSGTGALQALGLKFLRSDGSEIVRMCGKELASVARIDASGLDKRLKTAQITVMCDVSNPLTGEQGATYVYGPQKGAGKEELLRLEKGMVHFAEILDGYAGKQISAIPGAGAAGGIGAALLGFAGATLQRGIDAMLALVEFAELIKNADLIITGEGRVDIQSSFGKAIYGVAQYAKAQRIPVVVIAGSIGEGADTLLSQGISAMVALPDAPMSLDDCIRNAPALVEKAALAAFSLINIGRGLGHR